MRGHALLFPILALSVVFSLFLRAYMELLPGFADAVFGQGVEGLGTLLAAAGVGALVGGVVVANFGRPDNLMRFLWAFSGLAVAFQVLFSSTGIFWLGVLSAAGMGLAVVGVNITSQTLIQIAENCCGVFRGPNRRETR